MTSTIRTPMITVDASDIKKFASALRKVSPTLYKGLRASMRAAGKIVADDARARISQYSTEIGPTIKVHTAGASKVSIQTGNNDTPIATLLELGNKGSKSTTSFRHPVYGRDVWVDQSMHPYLVPALEAKSAEAVAAIAVAVDEVLHMIVVES